jgi:hypothetical protein
MLRTLRTWNRFFSANHSARSAGSEADEARGQGRALPLPALALGGVIAGALGGALPAEAIVIQPGTGIYPSGYIAVICGSTGLLLPPCIFKPQGKNRLKKVFIILDPPGSGLTTIATKFAYDTSLLAFDRNSTSLLCELRSAAATPFCPPTTPGQGTMPLGELQEFDVDQTGLTITEASSGQAGKVSVEFTSPTPISFSGARNFLALAFDLLAPIGANATVTYSPTPTADATFSITHFECDVACGSSHPTAAMKLNTAVEVPGPLAVGGLPVLLHTTRRLRRRLQPAAR